MKIEQRQWKADLGWQQLTSTPMNGAHLVLAFGSRDVLEDRAHFDHLRKEYPSADILSCSTSGEIAGDKVLDDSIIATAIQFDSSSTKSTRINIRDFDSAFAAGEALAKGLDPSGLIHAFVLSDGQSVNGSELVKGLVARLPATVSLTGGLAGDAARFTRTLVGLNAAPSTGEIAAIGFYGPNFRVGYGSRGGWDSFGPERLITKSKDNVLYELDGRSALDLYKEYLGDRASELPGAALLFPLSIKMNGDEPVVRTILSIDEEHKTMTFAGDLPEGAYARLMKANFDRLVDGASHAAESSAMPLNQHNPELAILISCVGRKLVLDQRIEEEVETVRDVLGPRPAICGFYSYGEISPFTPNAKCELHNQTMTITTFSEV
jgi:hypothetical protein